MILAPPAPQGASMWINREAYTSLVSTAAAAKVANEAMNALVFRLEAQITKLENERDMERQRAEAAVDNLIHITSVGSAAPISHEKREQADPMKFDNVFEEEDKAQIASDIARLKAGESLFALYEEAESGD